MVGLGSSERHGTEHDMLEPVMVWRIRGLCSRHTKPLCDNNQQQTNATSAIKRMENYFPLFEVISECFLPPLEGFVTKTQKTLKCVGLIIPSYCSPAFF